MFEHHFQGKWYVRFGHLPNNVNTTSMRFQSLEVGHGWMHKDALAMVRTSTQNNQFLLPKDNMQVLRQVRQRGCVTTGRLLRNILWTPNAWNVMEAFRRKFTQGPSFTIYTIE